MKSLEKFDYDARLTNIEGQPIYPTITCLLNKKTGLQFVPARITGITETGEITEYTVVSQIGLGFRTTTVPAKDLKYFGLRPLHLPETVKVNGKVDIPVNKEPLNESTLRAA